MHKMQKKKYRPPQIQSWNPNESWKHLTKMRMKSKSVSHDKALLTFDRYYPWGYENITFLAPKHLPKNTWTDSRCYGTNFQFSWYLLNQRYQKEVFHWNSVTQAMTSERNCFTFEAIYLVSLFKYTYIVHPMT